MSSMKSSLRLEFLWWEAGAAVTVVVAAGRGAVFFIYFSSADLFIFFSFGKFLGKFSSPVLRIISF